ncbi:hypothetical protein LBP_cg1323 [Lactiplantibacillus plantarum subsp. plantarum P-8]|nr:hypothetical protein LBP_cg1323 [Lactiplantibacillus plantarum subsp. plantarum P-8]
MAACANSQPVSQPVKLAMMIANTRQRVNDLIPSYLTCN